MSADPIIRNHLPFRTATDGGRIAVEEQERGEREAMAAPMADPKFFLEIE